MQAVGERFGVVVANIRVVQVEELEVRVVVQRVAEPNRALVVEELHVQNGRAAGDVLRVDLLLAALAGGGGGEDEVAAVQRASWSVLLPRVKLHASALHSFRLALGELKPLERATHLRVTIFPDGGIMRVHAFGTPADTGDGGGTARKRMKLK